MIRRYKKLTQI